MRYYTGIGSRKTPQDILAVMKRTAMWLEKQGWVLRSGGAEGADSAFESGVLNMKNKEIFYARDANKKAMDIASKFHPAWNRCSDYAKKLHSRNSFQVLGKDLKTPSKMVICWTPDGCISHKERTIQTGGTGTAISIADDNNIFILNLQRKDHLQRILDKIN